MKNLFLLVNIYQLLWINVLVKSSQSRIFITCFSKAFEQLFFNLDFTIYMFLEPRSYNSSAINFRFIFDIMLFLIIDYI